MDSVTELAHRIRIHDFTFYARPNADGFCLGDIPGIGMYPDRSILLPGTCYLDGGAHAEVIEEYLQSYLRPLGIGAKSVRFVKGDSLFQGILNDPTERAWLQDKLSNGIPTTLEAFSASPDWELLTSSLNIDPARLRTPLSSVMRMLDDKEAFRRLACTLGLEHQFPKHVFALEPDETLAQIRVFRKRFPRLVVVKRPDLESGVGQLLIRPDTPEEAIEEYVRVYCTTHRPIIIEEGVFGVEGSLQWHVGKNGIEPRFFGRQYTHNGFHEGNVISHDGLDCLPSEWPRAVRRQRVEDLWEATRVYVEWIAERGHMGPIGFDFFVNPDGFHFLECNARTTAATYLESVRWQVERLGFSNLSAAMKNTYPKRARDWRSVVAEIERAGKHLAFRPEEGSGVLIANPRLLHLPHPKCLSIAIGRSVEEAETMLEISRSIL